MHIPKILSDLLISSSLFIEPQNVPTTNHQKTPLVIWHGLTDSYNSTSIQRVAQLVKEVHGDVFVHSVYVDLDAEKDSKASLFGNAQDHVEIVCSQLSEIPELSNGFDAIGFSQGGLFMRAAIEKCNFPVNNLITFGSPHLGVSEVFSCKENDKVCNIKNNMMKKQVWRRGVQETVIPAQYFRDRYDYDNYIAHSLFLADINNEKEVKHPVYVNAIKNLNKFVMVLFSEDETLVPKESAWFGDRDIITGELIPLNETVLYKDDLIGIRALDDENKLDFLVIDGPHMAVSENYIKMIARKYLGSTLQDLL